MDINNLLIHIPTDRLVLICYILVLAWLAIMAISVIIQRYNTQRKIIRFAKKHKSQKEVN